MSGFTYCLASEKNSHFSGCPPFVGDSWKIHIILYFLCGNSAYAEHLTVSILLTKKYNCFNPHHHLNHVRHKSLRGVWPESGRTAFLRIMRKHVLCAREISWGQCVCNWVGKSFYAKEEPHFNPAHVQTDYFAHDMTFPRVGHKNSRIRALVGLQWHPEQHLMSWSSAFQIWLVSDGRLGARLGNLGRPPSDNLVICPPFYSAPPRSYIGCKHHLDQAQYWRAAKRLCSSNCCPSSQLWSHFFLKMVPTSKLATPLLMLLVCHGTFSEFSSTKPCSRFWGLEQRAQTRKIRQGQRKRQLVVASSVRGRPAMCTRGRTAGAGGPSQASSGTWWRERSWKKVETGRCSFLVACRKDGGF